MSTDCVTSHDCSLRRNTISHLPKNFPDASWSDKLKRKWKKSILVSMDHPQVFKYLKSAASVEKESQRQIEEFPWFIIHPLSKFRKFWNIYIFFVMFTSQFLTSFSIGLFYHLENSIVDAIHVIMFTINFVLIFEIILQFRTGYIVQETFEIVLDPKKIASKYLKTNFIPDTVACFPYSYIVVAIFDQENITIDVFSLFLVISLFLFFVYRFNRLMHYSSTISAILKISEKSTILFTLMLRSFYW